MKKFFIAASFIGCLLGIKGKAHIVVGDDDNFKYQTEQFADIRILRYQVPGFEQLSLKQKEMLYYLYEAALAGRDIMYDQNFKYNLTIRKTLEAIIENYTGDKNSDDFKKFMIYTKRVWFSNGIHHHYSSNKIIPDFSADYFKKLVKSVPSAKLPLRKGETVEQFINRIIPIMFDPKIMAKKVNLDPTVDLVTNSAVNFYEGVNQKEVQEYYKSLPQINLNEPVSVGLNSKLVKENGKLVEKVWKVGGMYDAAVKRIVYWLEKALPLAETPEQKIALEKLIEYHKTGNLKTFDEYNIAWVKDVNSSIDVVNGYIEVYNDPLGYKGSFESVVSVKDFEASKRIATIGANAQWFEDNSPILPQHKKKNVTGISAKVINVVVESGDAAPSTPIGINLPNAEWIREKHGSKSVNLGNIVEAYDKAAGAGLLKEFYYNDEMINRAIKYGSIADKLHTDMHEVIGHASGQLENGVPPSHQTLKNYSSCLEEARADLVALYYLYDPKLIDLGVMESLEVGKAAYDDYITNGLMIQMIRIKLGDDLEEAHMRNRQLVAAWVYEKGKNENVIEKVTKDGKTFFVVNDYNKLRKLFGDLLREIQRIKSQGDYEAGKNLVETYGVKLNADLHKEVLERYAKLNIAPYAGFIQPKLIPVKEGDKIVDVKIEYPEDFTEQMLYYGKNYSFLPVEN
jgi:dipeptidyl-peptidase-3